MTLALFDLDNTLIAGDSDHAWGEFAVENGLVDADIYAKQNDQFYADYENGTLDVPAYLRFALAPLSAFSLVELKRHHREFMRTKITPMWLEDAVELVEAHREKGHRLVVITSTNRFVVEPIVAELGISDLICSEPEVIEGRYTGNFVEEPCFREGKILKLKRWLAKHSENLAEAWFYSDSFNDLPLLKIVENPVAVDPDDTLTKHARKADWPIISLR